MFSIGNKWLLYSSTVILLSFIIISTVIPVECETSRGTLQSTRHLDKIPGSENVSQNRLSRESGGHEERNNHGNEVEPRNVLFGGAGSVEEDEEDDSYDDEDDPFVEHGDSVEFRPLENYDDEHGHHGPFEKPQIAKCCPYGEAVTATGECAQFRLLEKAHHNPMNHMAWFPKAVFDGRNLTPTNISEWDIQTSHNFQCPPNESAVIVSDKAAFAILEDGRLYLLRHHKVVAPLDFCVDQQLGKGEGSVVKSCFSKDILCSKGSQCLRKCCPDGSLVDEKTSRCSHSPLTEQYNFRNKNWTVLHEKPDCEFGHSLIPTNGSFTIHVNDSSLITPEYTFPFLQYCVDYFMDLNVPEDEQVVTKVLMCFNHTSAFVDTRGLTTISVGFATVIGISLVLSAISIAIAALVSWRLPELRSLHGKCQLSHLATLFCLFICLAIVQLGRERIPHGLCKFFAVFIHTCALSSFLWLNLLCFNIYMTFRSLRPPLAARRDENRRLFFLCIYAWGIPASFVAFLFVLDSQPGRLEPMPRPDYGVLKCLMSSRDAEFAYLFGPVGVLLLINGLLFCLTAQELLCGLWRLDNSDSITFRRKSMGLVVAKLGIVMGMGWILDVLSWGFGKKFPFLFYVGDVFNALQGVFICVVLLWRKRVLEVLHLRKPSITKDETLTVRPFLAKNGVHNASSHLDNDTSLVIVQDS